MSVHLLNSGSWFAQSEYECHLFCVYDKLSLYVTKKIVSREKKERHWDPENGDTGIYSCKAILCVFCRSQAAPKWATEKHPVLLFIKLSLLIALDFCYVGTQFQWRNTYRLSLSTPLVSFSFTGVTAAQPWFEMSQAVQYGLWCFSSLLQNKKPFLRVILVLVGRGKQPLRCFLFVLQRKWIVVWFLIKSSQEILWCRMGEQITWNPIFASFWDTS